jgi:cell division septal protein FtsQ
MKNYYSNIEKQLDFYKEKYTLTLNLLNESEIINLNLIKENKELIKENKELIKENIKSDKEIKELIEESISLKDDIDSHQYHWTINNNLIISLDQDIIKLAKRNKRLVYIKNQLTGCEIDNIATSLYDNIGH